jgi:hypothetical protein
MSFHRAVTGSVQGFLAMIASGAILFEQASRANLSYILRAGLQPGLKVFGLNAKASRKSLALKSFSTNSRLAVAAAQGMP